MIKYLLMAAAGYILLRGGKTGKSLKDMEILFENFRFQKFQNARAYFQIDLKIDNVSNNRFSFNEIVCDIIYKGQKAGKLYTTADNLKIEPRKITTIRNVSFYLNSSNILQEIKNILLGKMDPITIEGYLMADGIKFPVNETIEL